MKKIETNIISDPINQAAFDALVGREFSQAYFWGELLAPLEGGLMRLSSGAAALSAFSRSLFGPFRYYYLPRGPRGKETDFPALLRRLVSSRTVFVRLEPETDMALEIIKQAGLMVKKSLNLQPRQTLMLDLTLSEEELLSAMSQKTRYNIRLAAKKGVRIVSGSLSDFPEFWRLMSLTGERDAFHIHDSEHYRRLLSSSNISLLLAEHEGRKIAAGIFCFFGGRATYLHGASDNEARNLMAPHLLQWQAIKEAKKRGCQEYDFYGIDEEKWPGVTRFKRGFGGFVKEYPGTYDIIFRPAIYNLYGLLRAAWRFIRRFIR